ncbi:IS5/IS1182 family transposase, partial [Streptomyces sp. NPDC058678]
MPEEYGPCGRVYDLFRRSQRNGTWQRIFTELQARADAKDLITWDLNIDSAVCRAHQHAAGARKRGTCRRSRQAASPPSPTTTASGARAAADHQAAPRRRAGTKAHVRRDHAGQRGDSPQFEVVLGRVRVPRPGSGRPRTRPRR